MNAARVIAAPMAMAPEAPMLVSASGIRYVLAAEPIRLLAVPTPTPVARTSVGKISLG